MYCITMGWWSPVQVTGVSPLMTWKNLKRRKHRAEHTGLVAEYSVSSSPQSVTKHAAANIEYCQAQGPGQGPGPICSILHSVTLHRLVTHLDIIVMLVRR